MTDAVLVMAYGSPRTLDEVEPYYTDIRGGRPPSADALRNLTARYSKIGGPSPLNSITIGQAEALQRELGGVKVYVGMKHWHPFVYDAVAEIHKDEVDRVIGLVLAPHFSSKSVGEYEQRIRNAQQALGAEFDMAMVESWYAEPAFVGFVAESLRITLGDWDTRDGTTRVFFTAHSIPTRIIDEGDPYAEQLRDSATIYADAAAIEDFECAWQSASATPEPWIGPDILERLEAFAAEGGKRAVVAPVGFTSDHLEILFDVDIECAEKSAELGLELRRVRSPNTQPGFIKSLADVVRRAG